MSKPKTGDLLTCRALAVTNVLAKALYYYMEGKEGVLYTPSVNNPLIRKHDRKDLPQELIYYVEVLIDDIMYEEARKGIENQKTVRERLKNIDFFVSDTVSLSGEKIYVMIAVYDFESDCNQDKLFFYTITDDVSDLFTDENNEHYFLMNIAKHKFLDHSSCLPQAYNLFNHNIERFYQMVCTYKIAEGSTIYNNRSMILIYCLCEYFVLIVRSYFHSSENYTDIKLINKYLQGNGLMSDISNLIKDYNYFEINPDDLFELKRKRENEIINMIKEKGTKNGIKTSKIAPVLQQRHMPKLRDDEQCEEGRQIQSDHKDG